MHICHLGFFTSPKLKVFYLESTWYMGIVGAMVMEARKHNMEAAVKLKILEFVLGY